MTRASDLAWLAGLMEGEGCFTDTRDRHGRMNIRTSLAMNDRDVVERAWMLAGFGAVRYGSGQWWWTTSGKQSALLMVWLYGHLGERRSARIRGLLTEWLALPPGGHRERDKTHCKHNHPLSGPDADVRVNAKGHRACRVCARAWAAWKTANDPAFVERKRAKDRERARRKALERFGR